jgi:hypothetical protein
LDVVIRDVLPIAVGGVVGGAFAKPFLEPADVAEGAVVDCAADSADVVTVPKRTGIGDFDAVNAAYLAGL